MKYNSTPLFSKLILTTILFVISIATYAQPVNITAWDFNGVSDYGDSPFDPTSDNTSLVHSGLTRGSGTSTGGAIVIEGNAWGGRGFGSPGNKTSAISASDYFYFTVSPITNTTMRIDKLGAHSIYSTEYSLFWGFLVLSEDGPSRAIWQFQKNSDGWNDITSTLTLSRGSSYGQTEIDLTSYTELQNITATDVVTFRLVGWNAGSNNGGMQLKNNLAIIGYSAPTFSAITGTSACGGGDLDPSITVNNNGSTITSEGWEMETAVGNGIFASQTFPYTVLPADDGKKIRYKASNTYGTTYSDEIVISYGAAPTISSVTSDYDCSGGWRRLTLSATASDASSTINWYNNSTGGSSINTGSSYQFWNNSDQIFWVDATNSCGTTPTRTPVFATKGTPSAPLGFDNYTCGTGTVTLGAAGGGTLNWYDAASGGTYLGSGVTYTTPSLTNNTTYYVSDENPCGESPRTAVTATVLPPAPALTEFNYGPNYCSGTTFSPVVSWSPTGTLSWIRATVSGISNLAGSGSSAPIETLTNTTNIPIDVIYHITLTSVDGYCSSTTNETVTVDPTPSISPIAANACSGSAFNVIPTNNTDGIVPTGTTYSWNTPTVTGGMTGGTSGSDLSDISGTINNPNTSNQTATYTVTPLSEFCYGAAFSVVETIKPTPSSILIADGNTTVGGTVNFEAICTDLPSSTFEWFQTDISTNVLGSNDTYTTPILYVTTDFYAEATYNGCTSARSMATATVSGGCIDSTVWTGTVDSDWNNSANWSDGVPCTNTSTTIPDVSTTGVNYPIISAPADCDTIIFEPGAAVLGLENLTYHQAIVKTEVQREKWYTLTPPLKEMYAGDYSFSGRPVTQMRLFDAVNPDSIATGGITYTADWTRPFQSPDVAFAPGSGFTYYVHQRTFNYPDPVTYETSDVEISFPRTNNDGSLKKEYEPYSTYSGMILSPTYSPAWTVTKDENLAYRFAAENASNQLVDVNTPLTPGINLVGNPLMTHLDFDLLYAHNSDISDQIKYWNGTTFVTYMAGSDLASSISSSTASTHIIPPMQSFFVISGSGGTLNFDLDNDFVANNQMNLRGASVEKCLLHVESDNGNYKSSTAIARREYAENRFEKNDAFKMFSKIKEVPEVYTLADGVALDINQFDALPFTIPLGIKTDANESINLRFNGADTFGSNVIVELINAKTGEVLDLREENNYEYAIGTNKDEGSLFVSFRSASVTTDNSESIGIDHNIHVYATNKKSIRVESIPNDPIKEVIVLNMDGRTVQHLCVRNTYDVDIPVFNENQVYLVQVYTENNTRIAKILMK